MLSVLDVVYLSMSGEWQEKLNYLSGLVWWELGISISYESGRLILQ